MDCVRSSVENTSNSKLLDIKKNNITIYCDMCAVN